MNRQLRQKVIAEAPQVNAVYADENGNYFDSKLGRIDEDGFWDFKKGNPQGVIHNLSDLRELEEEIRKNAELGLKSCALDLTKGHLSQCESALESRDELNETLNNRITELEKNISMLEQYNGSVESLVKNLKAHNLEQRAKCVEYLIDNESSNFRLHNGTKRTAIFSADANRHYLSLKNQAKALKESKL